MSAVETNAIPGDSLVLLRRIADDPDVTLVGEEELSELRLRKLIYTVEFAEGAVRAHLKEKGREVLGRKP